MMKNKKGLLILACVLIIFAGAAFYNQKVLSADSEKEKSAPTESKVYVQVQQIKETEAVKKLSFDATLEPVNEGIVSAKVSGKVVKILFENGQKVSQGQPLIVLDDQDIRSQLNSALANLRKMEVNLKSTQQNYDRAKLLLEQGGMAQADFDNADTALQVAKADLESVRVNVQNLKDTLGNTVIKAPVSGVMDEKNVNLGQIAAPGVTLAKVKDISAVYAEIEVEQSYVNNIKSGQKAVVKLNDGNDASFEGVVKRIDVSADPSARVFNCKIQVENKNGLLHPGVFAKVEIAGDQKMQVITVPLEALAGNEGNYYVLINDNGVARKCSVTIGDTIKNMVEIKSGVQKGNAIICTNVNTLQDGDAIIVVSK